MNFKGIKAIHHQRSATRFVYLEGPKPLKTQLLIVFGLMEGERGEGKRGGGGEEDIGGPFDAGRMWEPSRPSRAFSTVG